MLVSYLCILIFRVTVVFQVHQVHLAPKAKASLALWFVSLTKTIQILTRCTSYNLPTVNLCAVFQGPSGLPGLPGEPGPEGVGLPGPKVCAFIFWFALFVCSLFCCIYNCFFMYVWWYSFDNVMPVLGRHWLQRIARFAWSTWRGFTRTTSKKHYL